MLPLPRCWVFSAVRIVLLFVRLISFNIGLTNGHLGRRPLLQDGYNNCRIPVSGRVSVLPGQSEANIKFS